MGTFFTNPDHWLIIAAIVGQSLDIGTTHAFLKPDGHCHEAVWPTQNPWVITGVKSGATFTLAWGAKKGKGGFKTIMRAGLAAAAVSGAVAGVINYNRCLK